MCRNIRVLFNFQPPATDEEMRAAALQYVRKVSGARSPSRANQARFDLAVEEVFRATRALLSGLRTEAPARSREVEAARARVRSAQRYGRAPVGVPRPPASGPNLAHPRPLRQAGPEARNLGGSCAACNHRRSP